MSTVNIVRDLMFRLIDLVLCNDFRWLLSGLTFTYVELWSRAEVRVAHIDSGDMKFQLLFLYFERGFLFVLPC